MNGSNEDERMDSDLALVLGLVIALFSIPALVSAFSDSRPPLVPVTGILIATGLVGVAYFARPGGYAPAEIPQVFVEVVARFWP